MPFFWSSIFIKWSIYESERLSHKPQSIKSKLYLTHLSLPIFRMDQGLKFNLFWKHLKASDKIAPSTRTQRQRRPQWRQQPGQRPSWSCARWKKPRCRSPRACTHTPSRPAASCASPSTTIAPSSTPPATAPTTWSTIGATHSTLPIASETPQLTTPPQLSLSQSTRPKHQRLKWRQRPLVMVRSWLIRWGLSIIQPVWLSPWSPSRTLGRIDAFSRTWILFTMNSRCSSYRVRFGEFSLQLTNWLVYLFFWILN